MVFTCFKMNSQTGITSRCGDYMGIQEASSILIFFFQHKPKSRKGNVSPRLSCQNMWVWLVIKFSGWGECAIQMLCFHFLFLCNLKKYSQQRGNFLLSQGRKWHRKEVKWCFLYLQTWGEYTQQGEYSARVRTVLSTGHLAPPDLTSGQQRFTTLQLYQRKSAEIWDEGKLTLKQYSIL